MTGYEKMIQALLDGYVDMRDLVRISSTNAWQVRRWLAALRNAGHLIVSPRRYHLLDSLPANMQEPLPPQEPIPQEPVIRLPEPGTIMERALQKKSEEGVEAAIQFLESVHISRDMAIIALVGAKRALKIYGVDVMPSSMLLRLVKKAAA